jgi:hypothetical protein
VTLQLHVDLYPLAAIETAIAAFAAFGEFTVERSGDYHRVTLRPRAGEPGDELGRKFTNYVLGVIGVTVPPA